MKEDDQQDRDRPKSLDVRTEVTIAWRRSGLVPSLGGTIEDLSHHAPSTEMSLAEGTNDAPLGITSRQQTVTNERYIGLR